MESAIVDDANNPKPGKLFPVLRDRTRIKGVLEVRKTAKSSHQGPVKGCPMTRNTITLLETQGIGSIDPA
jgi:predicted transcriptional regulator